MSLAEIREEATETASRKVASRKENSRVVSVIWIVTVCAYPSAFLINIHESYKNIFLW